MPGICLRGAEGGLGEVFVHQAYAGHIFTAPPKIAKSRAGPKPRETRLMAQTQAYAGHMPDNGVNRVQCWLNRHMPGIFVAICMSQAYARHFGGIFGQCSCLRHNQAYAGHIFTAPPKCAKSLGTFGPLWVILAIFRHMPGIFAILHHAVCVPGEFWAYA